MSAFIEITNLSKSFQMGEATVHALAGVSLTIEQNAFCLIMGPSGSGKSTLLYLLGGLDRPTSGSIQINGLEMTALDENALARFRQKTMGFVFQSFNLIPSASALDNVAFPARFARMSARERKSRGLELLERVKLLDRAYHKPSELSGGQQQRVAIARALINRPTLILADEPTGNLDTASGESIMALLQELHTEGATVIIVSHDPRLTAYATQIVQILDGKITPESL
ncbi:MAG: ABC transporter ATP-binding protein [Anaerolineales bacterium]|jgi:putative ABC transport system ATP-binding protein|nr:ABC transporter ATP-binding protein [Anaerolineales bacterium]